MFIDRFYEFVGTASKRVWHKFIGRPLKNYNVEARAYKEVEKKHSSPWHESTQKVVQSHKQELHDSFSRLNAINPALVDRLKKVKVDGTHEIIGQEPAKEEDPKSKLPSERHGFEFPYVFLKPETVPANKIAVLDLLEMLVTKEKEKLDVPTVANMYGLRIEDVENITKYVDIFLAVKQDNTELELYKKTGQPLNHVQSIQEGVKILSGLGDAYRAEQETEAKREKLKAMDPKEKEELLEKEAEEIRRKKEQDRKEQDAKEKAKE